MIENNSLLNYHNNEAGASSKGHFEIIWKIVLGLEQILKI